MAISSSAPRISSLLFVVSCALLPFITCAAPLSLLVSTNASVELHPSLILENSPGTKPGSKVKCDRLQIQGVPRLKNLKRFADSVKVKVSHVNTTRQPITEICFHRNASLGVGMCPPSQWKRLNKGLWVGSMSPFDHKFLDIRIAASSSESFQVTLDEEFYLYRIVFLVVGIILMSLASWLSKSLVFYYSSAMAVGIFLVILMVLFQGMKLLPTGRKSSLAIFVYSCFVGLGSFLLGYIPKLLNSVLVEIGISEDMYNPLAIFLVAFLMIAGAWLGYWVVRKLVLDDDGDIDVGVSQFVSWSIRIVASVMILQSTLDPLLAVQALVGGIFASSMLKELAHPKVIRRAYKKLSKFGDINLTPSLGSLTSSSDESFVPRHHKKAPQTPVKGSAGKTTAGSAGYSPSPLADSGAYYSTFHNTPERRKFSKDEWDKFTKDSTQKALEELVSSPDFGKWAVAHADRITLAPKEIKRERRWFNWL